MSEIVLSSAVRQNLLSLQSTASLLAATQSRLSTGNKVNSALDNPTNYFTSQSLNNRASDISNLLDGVSNGVQVLQAANTGITSLQKLVDSAKSVANQALQASVGYSTKANIASAAVTNNGSAVGASDLRGLGTVVDNSVTGSVVSLGAASGGLILGTSTLAGLGTGGTAIADGDSITVNGKTITFNKSNTTTAQTSFTDPTGNTTFYLSTTGTAPAVNDLLSAIDTASGNTGTGSVASTVANSGAAGSALALHTGVNNDLVIGGASGVLAKLGLTAATTNRTGDTLSFTALGSGQATTVTFGNGTGGTVKSLTDLNNALGGDNLTASIDSTGKLTISTNNDYASSSLPTVAGTATSLTNGAFKASNGASTTSAPIKDAAAQSTRASLVSQYNNIITQITTTAQDASFNGVNLLGGDQLKLVFNETGKSTLSITGVNDNPGGLGLSALTSGTDFIDNASTNKVLDSLTSASSTLRSQASTLGSNLSIVQIRQDFSKNLINVLQTGASNLTLADTNEEAANSQALSTRQSIAVSALSLANTSQQSVLQLLR